MSSQSKTYTSKNDAERNMGSEGRINPIAHFFSGPSPSSRSHRRAGKTKKKFQNNFENGSVVSTRTSVSREVLSIEKSKQESLQNASIQLIERLFLFLSMLPSPDEYEDEEFQNIYADDDSVSTNAYSHYSAHYKCQNQQSTDRNRGLTLPAAAIGWLAHKLYPEDPSSKTKSDSFFQLDQTSDFSENSSNNLTIDSSNMSCSNVEDSMDPSASGVMDPGMSDKLILLKWLLRKVTHLKVSSAQWPPDPPSTRAKLNSNFSRDRNFDLDNFNDFSESASFYEDDSSIATNDFSTNSFLINSNNSHDTQSGSNEKRNHRYTNKLWHELRSFPRVDLQIFPNLNVLILDGIPPEWIENLNLVQDKLQLISSERGAIFHLNNFLFPSNIKENKRLWDTDGISNEFGVGPNEENYDSKPSNGMKFSTYPKLTHLKLSHCAIGEMSGLSEIKHDTQDTDIALCFERKRRRKRSNNSIQKKSLQLDSLSPQLSPSLNLNDAKHPPPLSRLSNLQTLSLSNNQIIHPDTALSGLASLPNLASIDLSFNFITSMKKSYLKLGNIRTLILSNNKITTVANGLDRLFSLEILSLDRNRIDAVQNVVGLVNLPFLARLDLWGNPFMEKDEEGYRVNVLSLFLQARGESDLPTLDNLRVSQDELQLLESLDFGDIVKVNEVQKCADSINHKDDNDDIPMEDETEDGESKGSGHQKYEIPSLAAADDTDTSSSTSSFPQSGISYQASDLNSTNIVSDGKKIKRVKKRRNAPIDSITVENFQSETSEHKSFCTIFIEDKSNHTMNEPLQEGKKLSVVEDVIDHITAQNPYLIQTKIVPVLFPKSRTNANRKSDATSSQRDNFKQEFEIDKFDKSRLSFLTLNIDVLDDDDDSQGDYNLLSMSYTANASKKDSGITTLTEYVPLFDDDIDDDIGDGISDDIDGKNEEKSNASETFHERFSGENEKHALADDGNSLSFDVEQIPEKLNNEINDSSLTIEDQKEILISKNEVEFTESHVRKGNPNSNDSLLDKLNKLLTTSNGNSSMSNSDDDSHDEYDDNSSVSTLGSLQSFPNKKHLKPISFDAMTSFSQKKTSENISLIQELLADGDDDDYWNDEYGDNCSNQKTALEPTSMLEGIENLKTDSQSMVAQYEFDFDLAELYATYDAPQKYADKPVSGNLDLYFRTYVFPLTIYDENDDEKNNLEKLLSIAIPRIQLCLADRNEILVRTNSFRKLPTPSLVEDIRGGERFIRFWYDKVLPCGIAAKSRIEPVFSKSRGFHGESLMNNGKHTMISESQPSIICFSDSAIYFMTVKYKQKRQTTPSDSKSLLPTIEEASEVTFLTRLTKNGEDRTYPSPLPVTSLFKDCNWPHALARHSLAYLKRITIGFGFQRLTFHFQVPDHDDHDDEFSSVDFTYIIHTWNKKRTVSIIQALQSNNKGSSELVIDNDDALFLDSLGKAIHPKHVGSVLHYQILLQKWKRGGRNTVRRACVVTDTLILLLDENYIGDGSKMTHSTESANDVGNVELKCVDSAPLEYILEVQASDQDPNELTIVIQAPSFLQRSHRWRLICKDRDSAERLLEYIRNGMG